MFFFVTGEQHVVLTPQQVTREILYHLDECRSQVWVIKVESELCIAKPDVTASDNLRQGYVIDYNNVIAIPIMRDLKLPCALYQRINEQIMFIIIWISMQKEWLWQKVYFYIKFLINNYFRVY